MTAYISASTLLLAILALTVSVQQQQFYKKYINNYDPNAKCLDGTPPLYYVHQGNQTKKFLIFLEGGGFCGQDTISKTLQSCYQRSKTILGSSTPWPDFFPSKGFGYLQTDPQKSKFAGWSKFIFGYCDGAIHQGYSQQSIDYKDAKLYFRGSAITKSHFNHLNQQYGLFDAQAVVFTGGSAGGVANYFWTNYLKSKLKNPQVLMTIPDSGIFLDAKSVKTGKHEMSIAFQNLYKFSNRDQPVPVPQCMQLFPKEGWKCLFFQNIFPFLKGKVLVVNSEYDSWAIPNDLHESCLTKGQQIGSYTLKNCAKKQLGNIQQYRKKYLELLSSFLLINDKSAWSISCSAHVYGCLSDFYDNQRQRVAGMSLKQAVEKFAFNGQRVIKVDNVTWPNNLPCAY